LNSLFDSMVYAQPYRMPWRRLSGTSNLSELETARKTK
jgi:hypothetical protein